MDSNFVPELFLGVVVVIALCFLFGVFVLGAPHGF